MSRHFLVRPLQGAGEEIEAPKNVTPEALARLLKDVTPEALAGLLKKNVTFLNRGKPLLPLEVIPADVYNLVIRPTHLRPLTVTLDGEVLTLAVADGETFYDVEYLITEVRGIHKLLQFSSAGRRVRYDEHAWSFAGVDATEARLDTHRLFVQFETKERVVLVTPEDTFDDVALKMGGTYSWSTRMGPLAGTSRVGDLRTVNARERTVKVWLLRGSVSTYTVAPMAQFEATVAAETGMYRPLTFICKGVVVTEVPEEATELLVRPAATRPLAVKFPRTGDVRVVQVAEEERLFDVELLLGGGHYTFYDALTAAPLGYDYPIGEMNIVRAYAALSTIKVGLLRGPKSAYAVAPMAQLEAAVAAETGLRGPLTFMWNGVVVTEVPEGATELLARPAATRPLDVIFPRTGDARRVVQIAAEERLFDVELLLGGGQYAFIDDVTEAPLGYEDPIGEIRTVRAYPVEHHLIEALAQTAITPLATLEGDVYRHANWSNLHITGDIEAVARYGRTSTFEELAVAYQIPGSRFIRLYVETGGGQLRLLKGNVAGSETFVAIARLSSTINFECVDAALATRSVREVDMLGKPWQEVLGKGKEHVAIVDGVVRRDGNVGAVELYLMDQRQRYAVVERGGAEGSIEFVNTGPLPARTLRHSEMIGKDWVSILGPGFVAVVGGRIHRDGQVTAAQLVAAGPRQFYATVK